MVVLPWPIAMTPPDGCGIMGLLPEIEVGSEGPELNNYRFSKARKPFA